MNDINDSDSILTAPDPGTFVDVLTILFTFIVFFRWINKKSLNIPDSIALSLSSLIASNLLIVLNLTLPHIGVPGLDLTPFHNVTVSFPSFVLDSALGFLLFSDAMELDIVSLKRSIEVIFVLAVFTTLLASLSIASFLYLIMIWISYPLPFSHCLLFGAIVSPTDPVAVSGILKSKRELLPKYQRFIIAGESLFNDAVSVVLFIGLRHCIFAPHKAGVTFLVRLFVQEVVLGVTVGFAMGYLAYQMLSSFESRVLEAHVTLVLVLLINMICKHLGASIPLASVIAGLMIGNYGVAFVISSQKTFHWLWGFINDTLNSVLYLLMGFISILFVTLPNIGSYPSRFIYYFVFLSIIPLSLLSRFISVLIPLRMLQLYYKIRRKRLHPAIRYAMPLKFVFVLTWSGMRGAISVALALSLPDQLASRAIIFTLCYTLVCFSTIVQGLLFEKVVGYLGAFPKIIRATFDGNIAQMNNKRKNSYLRESFVDKNANLKPLPSLSDLVRSVGLIVGKLLLVTCLEVEVF
ncbi:Na(+)/H(+) antiporter NhaP [Galdieria sulphuraria]|nr:Na(+)/H(+) antiporter NhaP [Galdieria sulphuraria]